jgi:LysM repeat protein
MLPSRFMRLGKVLPVLLLAVSCALCACATRRDAPVPAEPDREHSQGAPLQSAPPVAEQRLGETAPQLAAPHARTVPTQADSGYIILQPGETLSYISALYAVSERDLIAWNGLSSAHDVRAGQRLAIRPPDMRSASPQAGRAAASASAGVIVVAPGESLSGIALRHGVTVAQLRAWNGLTSDTIRAGRILRVQPPAAQASGSLGAPAAEGHPPQEPARGAAPATAATPEAPDVDGMITVQPGQSLSVIAATYKVSKADLRQWNKLKSDQLQIGQKLRVKAPVRIHTVKAGENLSGIAAKYKVSAKALMQKNKLAKADVLPVGKELIIP